MNLLLPIFGVKNPPLLAFVSAAVISLQIWSNSWPDMSEYWSKSSLIPSALRLLWSIDTLMWSNWAIFSHEKCIERKYSICSFVMFKAGLPSPWPSNLLRLKWNRILGTWCSSFTRRINSLKRLRIALQTVHVLRKGITGLFKLGRHFVFNKG